DTARSRFAMSTEWGKMEILGVIEGLKLPEHLSPMIPESAREALNTLMGEGLTVFRAHRSPHEADTQFDLVIAKRNPEALWISGYEDRILYDARRPADQKYNGLVQLLVNAMLEDTANDDNILPIARHALAAAG